jgi:hypothetical protein
MAGKGSWRRPSRDYKKARDNYDRIDFSKKEKKEETKEEPKKTS